LEVSVAFVADAFWDEKFSDVFVSLSADCTVSLVSALLIGADQFSAALDEFWLD
jgi:hypothetical protein